MISESPLSVLVTRDPNGESQHLVDLVVAGVDGPHSVWGDANRAVMARSAVKPIQTLPLIRSGAAQAYDLTDEQIALACASHSGEAGHLEAVSHWLSKIGGAPEWLECGPTAPFDPQVAAEVWPNYEAIHNCCSGKHSGFLSIATHLGFDHNGYINPDHPVQQLITEAMEVFTGFSLEGVEPGIDGCGIPTHPIPLVNLARGMARLVDPSGLDASWHAPAKRVSDSLDAHPWWESGTGRHEMSLHADKSEPLVCKTGAEGVFTAALPNRGIGVACKSRDGSKRGSDAAITWVLESLGAIVADASKLTISNTLGRIVGEVSVEAP